MLSCASCSTCSISASVPLVEQRVVALDVGFAVHAGALPLALGAAPLDLPATGGQLVPGERVDQLAVALGAQLERRGDAVSRRSRRGRDAGRALEVDDLHSLAAGEDDPLDLEIAHAQAVIGPHGHSLRAEPPQPGELCSRAESSGAEIGGDVERSAAVPDAARDAEADRAERGASRFSRCPGLCSHMATASPRRSRRRRGPRRRRCRASGRRVSRSMSVEPSGEVWSSVAGACASAWLCQLAALVSGRARRAAERRPPRRAPQLIAVSSVCSGRERRAAAALPGQLPAPSTANATSVQATRFLRRIAASVRARI